MLCLDPLLFVGILMSSFQLVASPSVGQALHQRQPFLRPKERHHCGCAGGMKKCQCVSFTSHDRVSSIVFISAPSPSVQKLIIANLLSSTSFPPLGHVSFFRTCIELLPTTQLRPSSERNCGAFYFFRSGLC